MTFPEGGTVVAYDIAKDRRIIRHKHLGEIDYLRRSGGTIAYVLRERGFLRMYKNGRRVSVKAVVNPEQFAIGSLGEVYFFTKAARGYSLYRDTRSYVTGQGEGAYVEVDPDGHVWHLSYTRLDGLASVSLQKDRDGDNLLPPDVANVELDLHFIDDAYAIRASFVDNSSLFWLVHGGETLGEPFQFEYPYNDAHDMDIFDDSIVLRAFRDGAWWILRDGESVDHTALTKAWFYRVFGDELTVYATRS